MRIYSGSLSHDLTEDDLREAFKAFGEVGAVSIVRDKADGKSKGFAFVEMPDQSQAEAAIAGLNGKSLNGKAIVVNEARPKK